MTTSRSRLLLCRALWKRRRLSTYCYISILFWLSRPQAIVAFSTQSPPPTTTTTPTTTSTTTTRRRQQHPRSGKKLAPSVRDDIDRLVLERTRARWEEDYHQADLLLNEIQSHEAIPPGYEVLLTDVPRTDGGGSSWELQPVAEYHHQRILGSSGKPSVLQLAHTALGLAVHSASVRHLNKTSDHDHNHYQSQKIQLRSLVEQAHGRLDTIYALKDEENDDENLAEWNRTLNPTDRSAANEPSLLTAKLLQYELGGRMSADAAFWFALAGIQEDVHKQESDSSRPPLLDRLASVAAVELERYGFRRKRRVEDIWQIVDRFAAAGVRDHAALENVVRACLEQKQDDKVNQEGVEKDQNTISNNTSLLQLHSDRSLFRLWKFSTRQKKQRAFLNSARKHWKSQHLAEMERIDTDVPTATATTTTTESDHSAYYDWDSAFEDTSRPLVVDIGCGMGVSLLGLASCDESSGTGDASASSKILLRGASRNLDSETLRWSECNFVGVDLGELGIQYAMGISSRFGVGDHLHFACAAAEDLISKLQSYPGELRLCMIQFPTPYKLVTGKRGNSQLPASRTEGFMVTESLLRLIHSTLHPKKGQLLLQSNCEDVAVWMKNMACQTVGFSAVDEDIMDSTVLSRGSPAVKPRLPQRTIDYVESGGERAAGPGWLHGPALHREARTETEVACTLNGTPIYRCILQVGKVNNS